MKHLHYFYPENDLALALNLENYTAPPAAVKLRLAGSTLPLWYGDSGDAVATGGVSAEWLGRMRSAFGLETETWNHEPANLLPAPWGWSRASRRFFARAGFDSAELPSDAQLERLRELSHRRTAARLAEILSARLPYPIAPAARELASACEVEDFLATTPQAMLKLPWSSSGRGLVAVDRDTAPRQMAMIEGMIRRQGSVTAEPRMDKAADFALLFTMDGGRCRYDGISVFTTAQSGAYSGNVLAPQDELFDSVAAMLPPGHLETLREMMPAALEEVLGDDYDGPLGVDMMVVRNAAWTLAPAVEINLRMTMGHVCLRVYDRHIEHGRHGVFTIGPATPGRTMDFTARSGRLSRGTLDMAQPSAPIAFTCSIK